MRRKRMIGFAAKSLAVLLLAGTASAEPADIAAGERLFRSQCLGCHSVNADENRAGPTLHGLFGRLSGTIEGFDFSDAMTDAAIEWTPESLDEFLADPSEVVPGTRMVLWGLDPMTRARLIAYLDRVGS